MTGFEVLAAGRIGVDIYPLQVGVGLEKVTSFGRWVGGSPTNVAVAAARHGRSAAVVTGVGDDPFGRFVRAALEGYGVDPRYVATVPGRATPVTFCEIFPPDHFPIYFYGRDPAPDLLVSEFDLEAVRDAAVFWVTVTGLCAEPSRSATLAALRARDRRGITVLDLDYRRQFWPSRGEARRWIREALPYVSVVVGNLDECHTAVDITEPRRAAEALRGHGVDLAVVKQGPKGVLADAGSGVVEVPPMPVEVVNGLGAGDAFGGALCHGLLAGWHLLRMIRFANAAGAIVASRLACSDAMPTSAEIETLLEEAADG
ncbi:MAG TPA: 5-dehydro-2-deoxygluconokinase [Micromonosporaceae bacterium]|jgi:5-dehydro-2-deoxygluconokinase|nr:5-dehydro-2-deoxygluconokinase [Micromonosporaceae bacterium]